MKDHQSDQMKKAVIIVAAITAVVLTACSFGDKKPHRVYMPDMAYSRAVETYSSLDTLHKQGIYYNAMPVKGTIKRGEVFPFPIEMDKGGDSTNYVLSRQVANPLPALDPNQMREAERLYLVNCGICHGTALDGNGPLYKDGAGPYAAAPKNLVADPVVSKMPDGQLFYSITYGKNAMGSYASQLSTTQRWMVIHYINSKRNPATPATPAAGAATPDSATAAAKK